MSKQSSGEWKHAIGAQVMLGRLSATVTAHGRARVPARDNSDKEGKAPLMNMCLLEIDEPSSGCRWILRGTWVHDSKVQPAPNSEA